MITIVDYGVGNLSSIQNMLKRVGVLSAISSDPDVISNSNKLILPGVGAFDTCASRIRDSGLIDVLNQKVNDEKVPILGICVGMQLMLSGSEEGKLPGLNWIKGRVVKFDESDMPANSKIPHMGWTDVIPAHSSTLIEDIGETPRFYFVHSYHAVLEDKADELLTAHYGYTFAAALQRDNITGVQFHPEKSHRFGMKLLENFAASAYEKD